MDFNHRSTHTQENRGLILHRPTFHKPCPNQINKHTCTTHTYSLFSMTIPGCPNAAFHANLAVLLFVQGFRKSF